MGADIRQQEGWDDTEFSGLVPRWMVTLFPGIEKARDTDVEKRRNREVTLLTFVWHKHGPKHLIG